MARMSLGEAMRTALNRTLLDKRVGTRKMTALHLARVSGLSDSSVRRRLDGHVAMDADYFEAICAAMGADLDQMWALARRIQDSEP